MYRATLAYGRKGVAIMALSAVDLLAPLYLSAGLAVLSSFMIRWYLPEDGPPVAALICQNKTPVEIWWAP